MDHLLPQPYIKELSACFDACPRSSASDVETIFKEEPGILRMKKFMASISVCIAAGPGHAARRALH
eukprot:6465478-Amphidinium_carterae.1